MEENKKIEKSFYLPQVNGLELEGHSWPMQKNKKIFFFEQNVDK